MALLVIAEPQAQFDAWRQLQSVDAAGGASAGQTQFVPGLRRVPCRSRTTAHGDSAPDLTHLMSRKSIAAGVLPNTLGNLAGWVANPQAIKPGSKMPNVPLSGQQLEAILDFLKTLT